MRLVLLPGMDGTGDLFTPFIREFGAAVQVVRYPWSEPAGYAELEALARRELPGQEDFFLLGESFSGPIAISIGAAPPPNLKGLILCCTFASPPQPLLTPFRSVLPLLPAPPPLRLLEALLCGRFANAEVHRLLADAIARVPLRILRARASAAASIDVLQKLRAVSRPVLCLRATEDRVVPVSAFHKLVENTPNVHVVELVAPHFLLQTLPQQSARAIRAFMAKGSHAT